ncbi:Gfo/Idh/MocA family oxidoreductase [Pseudoruegeria sp. HB172150]|uniref:Gfo/Idh/MocA family oxidoreductase n=1 Tax=Pseudoruegeria sp. HB172150 TaxID=2721164 RepID=UPI0015552662|nr:Gfo/Idh/MocA family oxidoreductase [Pseudoruegeria sp. HB172150]
MSVRVAVIGAGVMGADHARILAVDLPVAELRVVCDADPARAEAVAEVCGAGEVDSDPEAVIARNDVDAILIASSDPTHARLALACIAVGKPVLCEKPLAPTTPECLEVIAAEVQAGRRLVQVGFMRRFDPSYSAMKSVLQAGEIGRALMMHNFHRNLEAPEWFTASMAITNSAPHEFDAARFVLGGEIVTISAFQPRREGSGVPPVLMVLETDDSQLVSIEVNNTAGYGYDVRGELVGERGSVSLNASVPVRVNYDLMSAERYPADWRPRFAEAYRLQDMAWLRAVESGKPCAVGASAWDGYCATAIAEAGATALASGKKMVVDLAEKPALYARLAE